MSYSISSPVLAYSQSSHTSPKSTICAPSQASKTHAIALGTKNSNVTYVPASKPSPGSQKHYSITYPTAQMSSTEIENVMSNLDMLEDIQRKIAAEKKKIASEKQEIAAIEKEITEAEQKKAEAEQKKADAMQKKAEADAKALQARQAIQQREAIIAQNKQLKLKAFASIFGIQMSENLEVYIDNKNMIVSNHSQVKGSFVALAKMDSVIQYLNDNPNIKALSFAHIPVVQDIETLAKYVAQKRITGHLIEAKFSTKMNDLYQKALSTALFA